MFCNFDFISSDEDELEVVERLPRRRRPKLIRDRIDHFNLWNEEQFFMRFRLRKQTVLHIVDLIEPQIATRTNRNHAVSPLKCLLLTLRFFATGSFLICVGDFLGISKATACRIVQKVSLAIVSLRQQYIKMPRTDEELSDIRRKFFDMNRFPRTIGAIDCTHVKIQSPGGPIAEVYRNRKNYFSKNVQVVGGPDLQILDVVTRWAGSSHDQTVFNASRIRHRFEAREFGNNVLIGDSGYECRSYILVPLGNPVLLEEVLYNESLIRTRQCMERLFGVWKRRFPILSTGIRLSRHTMYKSDNYIVACAILHNIACIRHEQAPPIDPEVNYPPDDGENGNPRIEPQPPINRNNPRYAVRQALIDDWFAAQL